MNKYIVLSMTYGASAITSIGLTVGGLTDAGSILITGSTALCAITGLGFGIQDFRESLKHRNASSASVKNNEGDIESGRPQSLTSENLNIANKQEHKNRPGTPSTESLSDGSTQNNHDKDQTFKK